MRRRAVVARADEMLTPADVALMMGVSAKSVARWAKDGRLPSVRTPGGHHRFRRGDIEEYLETGGVTR